MTAQKVIETGVRILGLWPTPQFESGIPDKPEWFDTHASEEWDRITGNINGQRVST